MIVNEPRMQTLLLPVNHWLTCCSAISHIKGDGNITVTTSRWEGSGHTSHRNRTLSYRWRHLQGHHQSWEYKKIALPQMIPEYITLNTQCFYLFFLPETEPASTNCKTNHNVAFQLYYRCCIRVTHEIRCKTLAAVELLLWQWLSRVYVCEI